MGISKGLIWSRCDRGPQPRAPHGRDPERTEGGGTAGAHRSSTRCRVFEEEILSHLDALHRLALRLTGNPTEADDLVQETYLKALENWDRLEDWMSSRAWLFSILRHLHVDRYRRSQKGPVRVEFSDLEKLREPGAEDGVTATIFQGVLDEEVNRALELLPLEYREAVVLCDLNGLSYAETARVLGVPEGTVKSRLYRGRQVLKRALYQYAAARRFVSRHAAKSTLSAGSSSEKLLRTGMRAGA